MTPPRPDPAALEALLAFYVDAGIDCALDETPHDRFAEEAAAAQAKALPGNAESTQPPTRAPTGEDVAPAGAGTTGLPGRSASGPSSDAALAAGADEAVTHARAAAQGAATLDDLRATMDRFDGCALRRTARQLVFADGNPQARVMFVGEAPGADEDRIGRPFVGRSGHLLDRMLAAIDLDRTSVYIANIVPWRPPGNRTPTPQESATCLPFIQRQIELADPDILVCLGGPSALALLRIKDGILKTRGRWFDYDTGRRHIKALATLHPAYLLRQPLQKRLAWRDFRALRRALDGQKP